jgi:hypothetical protein
LGTSPHGFVALLLRDDTAWWLGRISFNPAKHFDPFGTITLPGILLLVRVQTQPRSLTAATTRLGRLAHCETSDFALITV